MAAKKRRNSSTKGSSKRSGRRTSAQSVGKELALEALALRAQQRRRREAALRRFAATARAQRAPLSVPLRTLRLLGTTASAGTLIAEGDSWFDYPLHDVLSMLEDEHGFDVDSVAHRGDRVEDMAFAPGQFADFTRHLEKLLRNGIVPTAILLSGGGNDIAGDEFGMLLNHARSPIGGVNDDVVRGVIDERIRVSYVALIAGITAVAQGLLGRAIPVLVHGYDHPVPDGRGFIGGFGPLPGPWLQPGFHDKGFDDIAKNKETMADLIDRFNTMLSSTAAGFAHVHYVDLRGTLTNDSSYKTFWANELHPTKRGFGLVAERFANVILKL